MKTLGVNARAVLTILIAYGVSAYLFFGVTQIDTDIGRDFVVPDLMLQGKAPYRDIEYWFGPFAPALHSCLFRIFGPSLDVIFAAGAVAGLLIVLLSYGIGLQVLKPTPACVGALIVLTHAVFGGSLLKYAMPYTYSATYGLLFALLALYSSLKAVGNHSHGWFGLAGCAAALAAVCKQEFAIIGVGTVALAVTWCWIEDRDHSHALRNLAAAALGFTPILLVAGILLLRAVTWSDFAANYYPRESMDALRPFYRNVQGWGNTAPDFIWTAHVALVLNVGFVVAAASALGLGVNYLRGMRPPLARTMLLLAAGAPFLWIRGYLWAYPATIAIVVLLFAHRQPRSPSRLQLLLLASAAILFGWRVLPNPDLRWYALLYFIPTLFVYLYLLFEIVIPRLEQWAGGRGWSQALALVLTTCFVIYHFFHTNIRILGESAPLVTERGTVRIPAERLSITEAVLNEIRRRSQPGDPILLIPGATMYYFLTNRRPASRYLDYVYATLVDGERELKEIQALQENPPRVIFLFPGGSSIYMPNKEEALFGERYNRRVYRWVEENYSPTQDVPAAISDIRVLLPKR